MKDKRMTVGTRAVKSRVPTGPFDYGDEATIGIQLKKAGKTLDELNIDHDFGIYCGRVPSAMPGPHAGHYVVVVKAWDWHFSGKTTAVALYPTEQDMKTVWEVD